MPEILKLIEVPALIALTAVVFLLCRIIHRFMDITERNGKAVQELTTWLKTKMS